jgi:signal recognition particle subunit SRP54
MQNIMKMGGLSSITSMLPGFNKIRNAIPGDVLSDKPIKKHLVIIQSMTRAERAKPEIIDGSRRRRIAKGSGTEISDVNVVLKQYRNIADMVKKMKGKDMTKMLSQFKMFG